MVARRQFKLRDISDHFPLSWFPQKSLGRSFRRWILRASYRYHVPTSHDSCFICLRTASIVLDLTTPCEDRIHHGTRNEVKLVRSVAITLNAGTLIWFDSLLFVLLRFIRRLQTLTTLTYYVDESTTTGAPSFHSRGCPHFFLCTSPAYTMSPFPRPSSLPVRRIRDLLRFLHLLSTFPLTGVRNAIPKPDSIA